MNEYIVSARKYRPATFKTVVGQQALTETLKTAIDTKRLAQAYLFCGPRGVGKTSCARIFAKTINCLSPTPDGEACGHCDSCKAIDQGNSFNILELDAASNNSVDDIRRLTEQVNIPPAVGNYRVFIIDEVHMLSPAAFNAFLKTLEEPPKYVIFILATTEKHKVIPTILSRCQIYDFKRITIQDTINHLQYVASQEGITAESSALNVIARKADGAMRDALSIFDQVAAASNGNITYQSAIDHLNVLDYDYYFRLLDTFATGNVQQALLIYKEIRDKGFDSLFFVNGLASHLRDLMVAMDPSTVSLLEVGEDVSQKFITEAKKVPVNWYFAALKILSDCDLNFRVATNKQLTVELALIRLCQLLHPSPIVAKTDNPPLVQPAAAPVSQAPVSQAPVSQAPASPQVSSPQPAKEAPAKSPVDPAPAAPSSESPVPKQRKRSNRPSAFRLNEEETPSSRAEEHAETMTVPAGEAVTLQQAWEEFIAANPNLHIMISAMKGVMPKSADGNEDNLVLTVDNPAQMQACEAGLQDLVKHLRQRTGRCSLMLNVVVDASSSEGRPKVLTNEEFLKKAVEGNKVIKDLLSSIEAELA